MIILTSFQPNSRKDYDNSCSDESHSYSKDGRESISAGGYGIIQILCFVSASPKALEIREEVGFFQAIESQFIKHIEVGGKSSEETDSAIRQIVSDAIDSHGMVDIFDALGLEKPEVSPLLSDKFLDRLQNVQQKNLALELLQKLINDELKVRTQRNIVQSKTFSYMLEQSVRKYQNRSVKAAQVINELLELAKEMREANKRGEELNLREDELCFLRCT